MADELVTLTSYRYAAKAEMVREFLAQAGIQAFVADAAMVTNDWFLGNAIGYVKLQVAESQAPAALEVLREHPEMLDTQQAEEEIDAPAKCLACGAAMSDDADRCAACGWSYDDGVEPGDVEKE